MVFLRRDDAKFGTFFEVLCDEHSGDLAAARIVRYERDRSAMATDDLGLGAASHDLRFA